MSKGAERMLMLMEIYNDEVMAESPESQRQEQVAEEKEEKNVEEETKGDEEDGENQEEEEEPVKPDSLTQENEIEDASLSQQQEGDKAEEVDHEDKKRKRTTNKETENNDGEKPAPRAKKPRATKPQGEPEYFEEKRNLQDLWKAAFPVGIEFVNLDRVYEYNWDFKHLEEALEKGGMLYGKKVFLFGLAEYLWTPEMETHVPTVVVIESPFPPSDKIGVTSVQRGEETVVPMKHMKMDWVPYIPFEKRDRQVDRMNSQIFILLCTQRRSALRHLKEDRVMEFQYCVPYFYDPFKEDEFEQSTVVDILSPSEPGVWHDFDWKFDRLEVFTNDLIEDGELSVEQKDEFKEYVKQQVRAARKARQEARDARMKAIEEMSEDERQAFQSIKFYKFYPQTTSRDIPFNIIKTSKINRYYGNAHQVL